MDSTTLLDSALFQLTPTRTRFDLVLFCGSKKEKVASGLFEPFISHLKFARDQISRGGYSISLRPPSLLSPWFTKSTFERFVRFVNTPAILERFVSLEKEISQIEHSIQANESDNANGPEQLDDASNSGVNGNLRPSSDSSKLRKESETNDEDAEEENSRIQLQRLLETRKTLLRREQAMAYARGVVAGFKMDNMDDLISFADAFGAARLKEACTRYKELWKKKHGDGLWMAELAAVEACAPSEMSLLGSSGFVLTNEATGLASNGTDSTTSNASSDSKDDKLPNSDQVPSAVPNFQGPMGWPNQIPQYFYPFQQPPPYQGYAFPPMQPLPHQYPINMPWPPKGKSSKKKGIEDFEGGSSESSESEAESDDSASTLEDQERRHSKTVKDHRRSTKNRKKPSKTVIIRNINYITPEGRNEDVVDDELIDKVSIKETVDAAVGLLGKEKRLGAKQGSGDDEDTPEERRRGESWDAFQNLLMRNNEKSVDEKAMNLRSFDIGEECFARRNSVPSSKLEGTQMKENVAADSFIVTQRGKENGGVPKFAEFESEESGNRLLMTRDSAEESMLLTKRSEISGSESNDIFYTAGVEKPVIKTRKGEDWFVADHAGKIEGYESKSFDDDCILKAEGSWHAQVDMSRKPDLIDDSFMVQSSLNGDDPYGCQLRPEISRVADLVMASDVENGNAKMQQEKRETVDLCEPNDLFMILERNLETVEEDSWAMDHGVDLSLAETDARFAIIRGSQDEDKNQSSGEKTNNAKKAEARGRTDSRSKIPGRSPNRNITESISKGTKKPAVASRTVAQKSKHEKEEEMRKRVEDLRIQRQKRIAERTAMATSRRASLDSTTNGGSITSNKNKTCEANGFTSVVKS